MRFDEFLLGPDVSFLSTLRRFDILCDLALTVRRLVVLLSLSHPVKHLWAIRIGKESLLICSFNFIDAIYLYNFL